MKKKKKKLLVSKEIAYCIFRCLILLSSWLHDNMAKNDLMVTESIHVFISLLQYMNLQVVWLK